MPTGDTVLWNDRLRQERLARSWRQADLAENLATSVVTVQRWEKGSQQPGAYFRARLCALYNKSAEELGFGELLPPIEEVENTPNNKGKVIAPPEERRFWNVPYPRNPHFTGREDLLKSLQEQLFPRPADKQETARQGMLTLALKGLGGIGKTQAAVEYAYRAAEQGLYRHVLWLNAASAETVLTSFVALAHLLPAIFQPDETDQQKMVTAIKRWLEECPQSWLLIADNADELSIIQDYLPQRGGGSVLLTTRAHAVGALAISKEIETMGWVEGMQLLLSRAQRLETSKEEQDEAMNVAMALDGFPLALDQAGAYIEETGCSFKEYLQLYQRHSQALLARRGRQASNYPDSVATTWTLSFTKVEQVSPAAAELLRLAAFLAPDRIPEELLIAGATCWPEALQVGVTNPIVFNQLIEALLAFSLVKRHAQEHTLSIHRLVQIVQRDAIDEEERRQWAERVVRGVETIFPANPKNDVANWPACLRYLEQAQACDGLIQDYQLALPEATELLERTGIYLSEHASYNIARQMFESALRLRQQQVGLEHPLIAALFNHLAAISYAQGKYAEAEHFYQEALTVQERTLGPEHLQVATSLNSLAQSHFEQGKHAEAERFFQQALQIREKQLGSEHIDVANSVAGLANLYADQGKYVEAEPLYWRTLGIWEQHLGPEHLRVATPLNGLGIVYTEQGKYAEAELLYQRALGIWEQHLGPEHPHVAFPLTNLADLYLKQGMYRQAEPLFQRALQIREKHLGANHLKVAFSLNNLAEVYCKQGIYERAEPLYQRSLYVWEQQLDPEHHLVAAPLTGLANLYREQGNYTAALPLYLRALHIREKTLGQLHPDTADTLHDFAQFQEVRGNLSEAASLYRRALEIREQVFGPQHSQTTATSHRLSVVLYNQATTLLESKELS